MFKLALKEAIWGILIVQILHRPLHILISLQIPFSLRYQKGMSKKSTVSPQIISAHLSVWYQSCQMANKLDGEQSSISLPPMIIPLMTAFPKNMILLSMKHSEVQFDWI